MIEADSVDVWRGSLDQPAEVREQLRGLLDRDERARAASFRFDRDRDRFVVGRGILRTLLARYLGRRPEDLRFRYGAERKPALVGDDLRFNLAHSEGAVLYAFSSAFEVGVDVELLRSNAADARVAERFFSPAEVAALRAQPAAGQSHAFLRCWTRKEAVIKALGDGLARPLDSFDVTLGPDEPAQLLRAEWATDGPDHWQLVDLTNSARGEVAALAAPARGWTLTCRDIDMTTLVFN